MWPYSSSEIGAIRTSGFSRGDGSSGQDWVTTQKKEKSDPIFLSERSKPMKRKMITHFIIILFLGTFLSGCAGVGVKK
jgi:hypothetical protein